MPDEDSHLADHARSRAHDSGFRRNDGLWRWKKREIGQLHPSSRSVPTYSDAITVTDVVRGALALPSSSNTVTVKSKRVSRHPPPLQE